MKNKKKFQRKKEDFTCNFCGFLVKGNGFTNHCPKCLWSKHVDINPGDRSENCFGMMEPVGVQKKSGLQKILHQCVKCGKVRFNKVAPEDDFEKLVLVSSKR